jgi:hypothetical protein
MTRKMASGITWVITSQQTKEKLVSHGWNVSMHKHTMHKHTMHNPNGDQVVFIVDDVPQEHQVLKYVP